MTLRSWLNKQIWSLPLTETTGLPWTQSRIWKWWKWTKIRKCPTNTRWRRYPMKMWTKASTTMETKCRVISWFMRAAIFKVGHSLNNSKEGEKRINGHRAFIWVICRPNCFKTLHSTTLQSSSRVEATTNLRTPNQSKNRKNEQLTTRKVKACKWFGSVALKACSRPILLFRSKLKMMEQGLSHRCPIRTSNSCTVQV